MRVLPEFAAMAVQRRVVWDHAKERAEANPAFTYSGIATGNPIDPVRYLPRVLAFYEAYYPMR